MANTKLIVLCLVLVLGQQSLCLSLKLGSLLEKVADQKDKLGVAATDLIGAIGLGGEDSIVIDDIIDDDDQLGNEVIPEEEKEEVSVEEEEEDEVSGPEVNEEEAVEEFDLMSRLENIEKGLRTVKRIGRKQLEATKTLIQLINETKTDECSAQAVSIEVSSASLPKNCKEVLQKGNAASGVYTIGLSTGLFSEPKAIRVFCDMETDGGGWMVFQRRQDGTQNFKLGWVQYMQGFGDVSNEFWLGNHALNLISTSEVSELRVDMRDGEGVSKYAKYAKFQVGSEAEKFSLTISGYTGDAGDSLSAHNGYKFSTFDKDNDVYSGNCASMYKGAWWYSKCHSSNLNGAYLNGAHKSYADGVEWRNWHGYHYSIQFTEMKIRPVA